MKLLIISDDFTGALDAGVRLHISGVPVRVAGNEVDVLFRDVEDCPVLIIDAETRHLDAADAYGTIEKIMKKAIEAGFDCFYKKTDSTLRGNIGSELEAVLRASQKKRMHFIPAFPSLGRTTLDGVQYVDDVPISESIFREDLFEPICYSEIKKIIASQSDVATQVVTKEIEDTIEEGILIYDAVSDTDLKKIAIKLKEQKETSLMAGCAGFAELLPEIFNMRQKNVAYRFWHPKILVASGSTNPITRGQLDYAAKAGAARITLTARQMLDSDWLDSHDGENHLDAWVEMAGVHDMTMIESSNILEENERYAAQKGINVEQTRQAIAYTIGRILKKMILRGLEGILFITGGDTLKAFLDEIGQDEMIPICEVSPGVVLSQIHFEGNGYYLISKSGGFGEQTLLVDLQKKFCKRQREG